jgi:hypothetical protein
MEVEASPPRLSLSRYFLVLQYGRNYTVTAQLASCELRTIQSSMEVGGVDLLGGVTFHAPQQVVVDFGLVAAPLYEVGLLSKDTSGAKGM